MSVNLKSLTKGELAGFFKSLGEPGYRGEQVFRWLWQRGEEEPENFTDLPKSLRRTICEKGNISSLRIVEWMNSRDGSIKFLMGLNDGLQIESVFIPLNGRRTVCVSSQVGCPLQCRFCATGTLGIKRNLEAWEIADQVLQIKKFVKQSGPGNYNGEKRPVTNVVFMGMGEPFLNTENVLKSLDFLNSPNGLAIGARHITLSTVGITPGIYRLAEFEKQVKLAISLHTAIQEKREEIMPVAKKYPLKELRKACFYYVKRTGKRITFEIVHLPGITDTDEDIKALERFLSGLIAKINLIPYNPFPSSPFREPREDEIRRFYRKLEKLPYTVTLRQSKGRDIQGACGQLALFSSRKVSLSKEGN